MKNPQGKFLKILLTGVIVVIPALLAAHFVQAISLPLRMLDHNRVAATTVTDNSRDSDTGLALGLIKVATDPYATPKSLVTGVLYTKGKAMVDWNGARIPVENGSYAYVGGEIIEMAPDAIGVLKLADGGSVHICPGARVRLSRSSSGEFYLNINRGASRFKFRADKAFEVKVNDVVMTSAVSPQSAGPNDFVTAEVHAKQKSGCIVCGLKSNLKVTSLGKDGNENSTTSPAGELLDVNTGTGNQASSLVKTPIPADIMSGMTPASAGGTGQGNAYLCRCQEIQQYAKDLAEANRAIAQAITEAPPKTAPTEQVVDTTAPPTGPVVEPPSDQSIAEAAIPPPATAPPVAPPIAPPLALAVPGAPDPFDPNVLPPPAAGEPDEPILVVAPPVIPVAGSGGGLPASPS